MESTQFYKISIWSDTHEAWEPVPGDFSLYEIAVKLAKKLQADCVRIDAIVGVKLAEEGQVPAWR